MSALAAAKYEELIAEINETTRYKSMKRAETRKNRHEAEAKKKELTKEFNASIRKVHEKSLSSRKPKAQEMSLKEALSEYYAEI